MEARVIEVRPVLLGIHELCKYLSMSENRARRFARDAGAYVRMGEHVLYRRESVDAEVERLWRETQRMEAEKEGTQENVTSIEGRKRKA